MISIFGHRVLNACCGRGARVPNTSANKKEEKRLNHKNYKDLN